MSNESYQVNVPHMEREKEMKNARAFRNSIRGKNALFCNWGCMKETRRSNVSEALGWLVDAAMPLKNSRKG